MVRILAILFAGSSIVSACIGVYLGRLHLLPFIPLNLFLIWLMLRGKNEMILGKLLYKLGLPYCEHCGKPKNFDDEKFNLGYKVRSMCPDCDRPTGMVKRVWFK